jgi:ArsR family metal-binding transcriptional regulator
VLTFKRGSREISVRPRLIAISDVADRDDAAIQAAEMSALINDTWDRRDGLAPNFRKRLRAPALTLYRMLPGGNCKACGEETCWIFAAKLSAGVAELDACTALLADTYAGRRIALRDLLAGAH